MTNACILCNGYATPGPLLAVHYVRYAITYYFSKYFKILLFLPKFSNIFSFFAFLTFFAFFVLFLKMSRMSLLSRIGPESVCSTLSISVDNSFDQFWKFEFYFEHFPKNTRFLSFDGPSNYLYLFKNNRQAFSWSGEGPSSHIKVTKMRFVPNIKYFSEPFFVDFLLLGGYYLFCNHHKLRMHIDRICYLS